MNDFDPTANGEQTHAAAPAPPPEPPAENTVGWVLQHLLLQRQRDAAGRFLRGTPTARCVTGERSVLLSAALAPLARAQADRWLAEHQLRRREDTAPEHAQATPATVEVETSADAWAEASVKRAAQYVRLGDRPFTATDKVKALSLAHDAAIDREGKALDRLLALVQQHGGPDPFARWMDDAQAPLAGDGG